MKIVFNTILLKNFLSYGNQETEIDLSTPGKTLLWGHSGSGKTSLLTALNFVLFDDTFRGVRKSQLINCYNEKDCVVKLSLVVNGISYEIVRGIKPNIFEIYKDGVLVDKFSETRLLQNYLENDILGVNKRSFNQVVSLANCNYVPFMKLSTKDRREFIEDVLSLNVFSTMKVLLKTKESELRDVEIDTQHKSNTNNDLLKKLELDIEKIRNIIENERKELEEKLQQLNKEKFENKELLEKYLEKIEIVKDKLTKLNNNQVKLDRVIQSKLDVSEQLEKLYNKRDEELSKVLSGNDQSEYIKINNKFHELNNNVKAIEESISSAESEISSKGRVVKSRIDTLVKECSDVENWLLDLEKEQICNQCQQPLPTEKVEEQKEKYRKQKQAKSIEIEKLQEELEGLREIFKTTKREKKEEIDKLLVELELVKKKKDVVEQENYKIAKIVDEKKKKIREKIDKQIQELKSGAEASVKEYRDKRILVKNEIEKYDVISRKISGEITRLNTLIGSIDQQVGNVTKRLSANNETELKTLLSSKISDKSRVEDESRILRDKLYEIDQKKDIYKNANILLKDSGLKSHIINDYLDYINESVTSYLVEMDFPVSFTLDKEFSENIESANHKGFSYESFSDGERQRIDLAMLFTWRDIAKLRNSVATNILFLDEVLDSHLSLEMTKNVMNMLRKEQFIDDNIFVISHKNVEDIESHFNRVVRFDKSSGFTEIQDS